MQEKIFTSIVLVSIVLILVMISVVLIMIKYYQSKEKHNKELYSSIIHAQEKERERLSRDVHDELGGLITSSRLTLESIDLTNKDKDTIGKINHLINVLEMASIAARNASLELSPIALQKFGIKGALDAFPDIYKSFNGIFVINCNVDNLNSSIEIGIYRIISEIINNSIKYSNANKLFIELLIDENSDLNVKISDNGIGFDRNLINKGNGIKNIENRCKVLNGQLNIVTSVGKGCKYFIKFKKEYYG